MACALRTFLTLMYACILQYQIYTWIQSHMAVSTFIRNGRTVSNRCCWFSTVLLHSSTSKLCKSYKQTYITNLLQSYNVHKIMPFKRYLFQSNAYAKFPQGTLVMLSESFVFHCLSIFFLFWWCMNWVHLMFFLLAQFNKKLGQWIFKEYSFRIFRTFIHWLFVMVLKRSMTVVCSKTRNESFEKHLQM